MWGYDRADESQLVPFKTQDQHFNLFCMVLERGFALHTGHSERLIPEFRLRDAGSHRYLPKVIPKEGVSFRIPESCLSPSQMYLHYDPKSETDLPVLACYDADQGAFVPYDYQQSDLFSKGGEVTPLPVVKLSTLRGLHYIKDIACLQMFELDFARLSAVDAALAAEVRQVLTRKLTRFVVYTHPWLQATHAERAAHDYLANEEQRRAARRQSLAQPNQTQKPAPDKPGAEPFMEWD
ncbi:MAG: hypothetical protein GYB33_16085 [Gammaproteobacteria bacterium]|nr:hypothetical protein [Gammaproteobacteria bacterium]